MDIGHPPVPPQPPTAAAEMSADGRVSVFRNYRHDQEVIIRSSGKVLVIGDAGLDLPEGSRIDAEIVLRGQRTAMVWDSSGCEVRSGAVVAPCTVKDREVVVSVIRQQPVPPVLPGGSK